MEFTGILSLINNFNINSNGNGSEYLMKTHHMPISSNDLWETLENDQLIRLKSVEQLERIYNLFTNSSIDINYIQIKSLSRSMKIYIKEKRIVYLTTSYDGISTIYEIARNINIKNINFIIKMPT